MFRSYKSFLILFEKVIVKYNNLFKVASQYPELDDILDLNSISISEKLITIPYVKEMKEKF